MIHTLVADVTDGWRVEAECYQCRRVLGIGYLGCAECALCCRGADMSTQELAGAQAEKEGLQMALTALERRHQADQDSAQREAERLEKVRSCSPGPRLACHHPWRWQLLCCGSLLVTCCSVKACEITVSPEGKGFPKWVPK